MSRRGVVVVAVLVAVLALAAVAVMVAAGDDDVTPSSYAEDVCRSISSYEDDLVGRVAQVGPESRAAATPAERRAVAVELFRDVGERVDRLREEVEEAGSPSGERGAELAAEMEEAFAAVSRLVDRATDDALAVRGDDFTDLDQDLRNSGASVSDALVRIRQDFAGTPAGDAIAEEPACADIRSLGGS